MSVNNLPTISLFASCCGLSSSILLLMPSTRAFSWLIQLFNLFKLCRSVVGSYNDWAAVLCCNRHSVNFS
uniref:Putative secreted protein n=1 Tax=Panstrongylus lignarius TaxID=156445 RepID=A0A224XUL9_9HEMI